MRKRRLSLYETIAFLLCIAGMGGLDGSPATGTAMLVVGGYIVVRQAKKEGKWR